MAARKSSISAITKGNFFPSPSQDTLRDAFVGKSLHEVPLPSAVLDVSKIKHNCKLMLDAVAELKLGFRAHVKTHKTTELTRLQVGEDCKDVRLIVSTVIEAESLVPMLEDYQSKGAKVNVLYGMPLGPSKVSRLAAIARYLGPQTVAAMIDNEAQLASVRQFKQEAGTPMCVFVKADSGYHRAGLPPSSSPMIDLVDAVSQAESNGDLHFLGFYSHNSLSYNGNDPEDAMAMLNFEIETCRQAAAHLPTITTRETPLVISVGATPTSISIQNLQRQPPTTTVTPETGSDTNTGTTSQTLLSTLTQASTTFALEVHAGVYPVFDLQQVSANSRTFDSGLAAHQTQALTILSEVVSTYPTRTAAPEALITAGTLALAREPCKSYPGWGVVTSWGLEGRYSEQDSVDAETRLIVKRISQEHGVVGWEVQEKTDELPVAVGERVRVWVNHACIAGSGFGWYLIVDEEGEEGGDRVVDVWCRWRGW